MKGKFNFYKRVEKIVEENNKNGIVFNLVDLLEEANLKIKDYLSFLICFKKLIKVKIYNSSQELLQFAQVLMLVMV